MSISIEAFLNEFNCRHDFDTNDVKLLNSRFYNTISYNIPEAWIYLIDCLLAKAYTINPLMVRTITHHYGFLSVIYRDVDVPREFLDYVKEIEKQLYLIDIDLHILLGYERAA